MARVRRRVALGGHDVPETVIRRRYERSLRNLRQLVKDVTTWRMYDASAVGPSRLIAFGAGTAPASVVDSVRWTEILRHLEEAE